MAWSRAALTKAVFAANGTNNYVLSDPADQGPYRTDVQAVADGSLTNGDTVHYIAWRTTTTGDAEFEEGHGAYTSSTRAIARTAGNVLDSDAGPGVLKDWGLSGQVDILILETLDGSNIPDAATFAANLGLPLLGAQNNFTIRQLIQAANAGEFSALEIRNLENPGTTSARVSAGWVVRSDAGTLKVAHKIDARLSTVTNGAETATTDFSNMQSGTLSKAFTLVGTSARDGSGNKYDAFPSGQVLLSESVPTGWTRGDVTGGRLIKLATSSDTLGAQAGSEDFFDGALATAGHTLQISEIPSHTHGPGAGTGKFVVNRSPGGLRDTPPLGTAYDDSLAQDLTTAATGGGGSHSHTIDTPNYRVMGRIVKS